MKRFRTILEAIYRLYEHSGFALSGAVAFAFVVSIFPFCIFLGALSGVFGGRELATQAITQLFEILPRPVVEGLEGEVQAIMGTSRIDLLTVSGFLALFFATSAIETMRAALNGAYRVTETRSYPLCLLISMLFVFVSAVTTLFLTWAVVVGPVLAEQFRPDWAKHMLEIPWVSRGLDVLKGTWLSPVTRYMLAGVVMAVQLFAFHLWLAAGRRRFQDVWPGILLSLVLWIAIASLWSRYLAIANYSLFYAGLSQLMIAMIFFQFTAVAVLLGAELNRGIMEIKRMTRGQPAAGPSPG